MKDLDLPALKKLCEAATPGWRAGRADMQSFGMDGIPYKALYNDIVEKEFTKEQAEIICEAGRIYGCNSINDSQFFAAARTAMPKLIEEVERLLYAGISREAALIEDANEENQSLRELLREARDTLWAAAIHASLYHRIDAALGEK